MTLKTNRRVLDEIMDDPAYSTALLESGWQVAREAAGLAPIDTGEGARSIRAEFAKGGEPEVRVSWDQDHFYMAFAEFGREGQPATPFLRSAAARYQ